MIAGFYLALYAALIAFLTTRVVAARRLYKIALLDNNEHELTRRIRAHANATEYIPLFALILFALEYNGSWPLILHGLGALFLIGRLMHAYGMLKGEIYENGVLKRGLKYRFYGMILTLTSILAGAVLLLLQFVLSPTLL